MTNPKQSKTDPESNQATTNNPYSQVQNPHILPARHPINILKRSGYIGASLSFLHHLGAPSAILRSPQVSHEWVKVGLAGTIAIITIKAYIEMYVGKHQKQTVNYKNFPQTTHVVMALLMITSLAFHVALWGHYGVTTFLVLFLVGVALLQTCLLIPTYLQNAIALIAMAFFLQQYK